MKRISSTGRNNLTFRRRVPRDDPSADLAEELALAQAYEERVVPVEGWDDDGHPLVVGLTCLLRAEVFAVEGGWSEWFLDVFPTIAPDQKDIP